MKNRMSGAYMGSVNHSQFAMPIPCLYATPIVPTICSLDTLVDTYADPMIHQGSLPEARKYSLAVAALRRDAQRPTPTTMAMEPTMIEMSSPLSENPDASMGSNPSCFSEPEIDVRRVIDEAKDDA